MYKNNTRALNEFVHLLLNLNGLKPVSALTIDFYLGNICPFSCNSCEPSAYLQLPVEAGILFSSVV